MAGGSMRETLRQIGRLFADGGVSGLPDAMLLRRFAGGDEEAFEALVARHGPMVLSVCRGVLRDPVDAEDAFQATFLTLARKARSIHQGGSLGGWLHRVARRTATRANARSIRRRGRELRVVAPEEIPGRDPAPVDDALPALHEEIDRLPESLRRPLVLCALEGMTQQEAALELGCGEATVRRRLAGAKERLRARLDRRGFALPPVGPVPVVPPSWVAAASKVAASRVAPATVAALVPALASFRWRWAAAALVRIGAAGLAGFVAGRSGKPEDPAPPTEPSKVVAAQTPAPPAPAKPKSEDETDFPGVVLDPAGKPFAGAKVYARPQQRPFVTTETVSDPGGKFRFTYDVQGHNRSRFLTDERVDGKPLPDFQNWVEEWPKLVAVAPGFGFGVGAAREGTERVVRLVPDEPVEGRVIDLQGRPVAGASVRVRGVLAPKSGDLGPWIDAARAAADAGEYHRAEWKYLSLFGRHRDGLAAIYPTLLPPVATDAEGRFRISGIGRERLAWVAIEKPGIESRLVAVATRPGLASFVVPAIIASQRKMISNPGEDLAVHGPRFEHVAGPGRAVEGIVLDKDTGAPVAGVAVAPDLRSFLEWPSENRYRAVADAGGYYRVEGLPEGVAPEFRVEIPEGQPYIGLGRTVAIGRGPAPAARADFSLRRGVWVEGRVLDGSTGRPLWSARVLYRAFPENPSLPRGPERMAFDNNGVSTDQEGRYRLVAYPGRGLIEVHAGSGGYASGVGADRIPGQKLEYGRMAYPTVPEAVAPSSTNLVAEVNPAERSGPIMLDLALQPARKREGSAVGPDGPIASGLLASGLYARWSGPQEVKGGRIEVDNLSPGEVRKVIVRLDAKKLIGLAEVKADEDGPFEVKLVPWGELRGRLVDAEGRPRSRGLTIQLREDRDFPGYLKGAQNYSQWPSPFLVGEDGRFAAEALLPGQPYDVGIVQGGFSIIDHAAKSLTAQPGEAKDLGDVVVKKP